MKVKVSELKSFKSNAGFIKQNNVIPILSYLKFEDGCITKNNLSAFLIQKVGSFKESFLVDEKILMNFIDCTSEQEIEIKLKDKRIFITDGNTKVFSPTDEVIHFPKNEDGEFDKIELDGSVLSAVRIASNFILVDESMPAKSNIFIGKKAVAGSNGFIAYIESFDIELPQIVLNKETAAGISKFDRIEFSQSDRYHFFENDKCKYGFIKPTYPFFDLTVFSKYDKEAPHFELNKHDLIKFNDMAVSSSPSKKIVASFKVVDDVMKLEMKDADYEIELTKDVSVAGSSEGVFAFMPVNMNQLLKNLPDNDLTFYQSDNKFYITGESGFTTLIMKVVETV